MGGGWRPRERYTHTEEGEQNGRGEKRWERKEERRCGGGRWRDKGKEDGLRKGGERGEGSPKGWVKKGKMGRQ